jgi:SAM-dependent methyltransferase
MGRYSEPLAGEFIRLVGVHAGQRALDVGCGPGALTRELSTALGQHAVAAVDPSPSFVEALRSQLPQVDVRCCAAEALPFEDNGFDLCLAQLVVLFMDDPAAGAAEMIRVTRPGGVVAACVWDHAGSGGPLSLFWRAVRDLDAGAQDEAGLFGTHEGQLVALFEEAGAHDVRPAVLTVRRDFQSFDEWWELFTLGVGPAGMYVAGLDPEGRDALRAHCRELLSDGPFSIDASAWTAVGLA